MGVVVASTDGRVVRLDKAGQTLWEFQVAGGSLITGGGMGPFYLPAVSPADVDGDGLLEFAIAGDDGLVYLLDGDGQQRWSYNFGRSMSSISTIDLNGDGRDEIVPAPLRGGELIALDQDGNIFWQSATTGEVGLIKTGDVDGDGQGEVVLLTAAWDLFLYESDGQVAWHNDTLALPNSHSNPLSGQFEVFDLDGDGQE